MFKNKVPDIKKYTPEVLCVENLESNILSIREQFKKYVEGLSEGKKQKLLEIIKEKTES